MRKHIFGIAIFSLIVGSAVLSSLLFITPPDVSSVVIRDGYANKRTSCFTKFRTTSDKTAPQSYDSSSLKIKQAVLNWGNKGIDWEIYVPESDASVALHLFAKSSQGVRYVGTEVVPLRVSSYNRIIKYNTVYISLNNLGINENLYAVPEFISYDDAQAKNFSPKFSENSATPVMIDLAKDSRYSR